MAIPNCTANTAVITNIGTTPDERGLTTEQFKAKFDEPAGNVKEDLNNNILPAIRDDISAAFPATGMKTDAAQTMTAQLTAKTGTDYTTKQVRNIRFKATDDFTTGDLSNGEIGFVYTP